MSPSLQIKLLQVLNDGQFRRVGENEVQQVDVRIIAATHRNLEELMEKGMFRRDLFYRLNVFPIYLPPLRERQIDIPELATDLLQRASSKSGIAAPPIDDEALAMLKGYHWPGNIRELQNHLERAMMLAEGGIILPRHLGFDAGQNSHLPEDPYLALFSPNPHPNPARSHRGRANESKPGLASQKRHEWLEREKERISRAISGAAGNKSVAARNLGIPRSTLVSRMRKLGLE
jgi:transcriptional regulator with PAS, ATPase and Fis domain